MDNLIYIINNLKKSLVIEEKLEKYMLQKRKEALKELSQLDPNNKILDTLKRN